jgi:predicted permease
MAKLFISLICEIIVAISLAGFLLAIIVPLLNRYRQTEAGDIVHALVIGGVIVSVAAVVMFRPGGAINRRKLR